MDKQTSSGIENISNLRKFFAFNVFPDGLVPKFGVTFIDTEIVSFLFDFNIFLSQDEFPNALLTYIVYYKTLVQKQTMR